MAKRGGGGGGGGRSVGRKKALRKLHNNLQFYAIYLLHENKIMNSRRVEPCVQLFFLCVLMILINICVFVLNFKSM